MKLKPIDDKSFSYKWKLKKALNQILESEKFQLRKSTFKSFEFFKNLFPGLLASGSHKKDNFSQIKEVKKLKGVFELKESNLEYMIILKIIDEESMIIKIAWPLNFQSNAALIIETFAYFLRV